MPFIETEQHLAQILSNIRGDARLSADERRRAEQLAQDQHEALISGKENDPLTWNGAMEAEEGSLALAPIEFAGRDSSARLGNVWSLIPFERSVSDQYGCTIDEATRLIDLACRDPGALSRDDLADVQELRSRVRLRSCPIWIFEGPENPDNPFAGVDMGSLPCQLGLPIRKGEAFAAFSLSPPTGTRRPCVFDAGWFWQQFWRPGGLTRPFCATMVPEALQEWVAEPPLLLEVDSPIVAAVAVDGAPTDRLPYDP